MKFRLNEEILTEDTYPVYREMLFNLIAYLCKGTKLGKFLMSVDRRGLQFHHIDSKYIDVAKENSRRHRYKAVNNDPSNIAIVTVNMHNKITNLNKKYSSEDDIKKNFQRIMEENPNEVFYLIDYLPNGAVVAIESEVHDRELQSI